MTIKEPLKVLDIFSGIGGFSLGLECSGMQTVGFCEILLWVMRLFPRYQSFWVLVSDVWQDIISNKKRRAVPSGLLYHLG